MQADKKRADQLVVGDRVRRWSASPVETVFGIEHVPEKKHVVVRFLRHEPDRVIVVRVWDTFEDKHLFQLEQSAAQ